MQTLITDPSSPADHVVPLKDALPMARRAGTQMWVAIKYQWHLAIDGALVQAPATTDKWDWLDNQLKSC